MTGPVEVIRHTTSLREAAQLLRRARISGAPVVDDEGRCIGVLSAADFVRSAERASQVTLPGCMYQAPGVTATGNDALRCVLPEGGCPVQVNQRDITGDEVPFCRLPNTVLADWQVVLDEIPSNEVRNHMTADPVMTDRSTPIVDVARMMVDAGIHRVIVIDKDRRPIGIVTSTDIVAAVARPRDPAKLPLAISTILYPTDLGELAEEAFAMACSLASVSGARLVVAHVYPPPICHGEVVARREPDGYEEDLWRLLQRYKPANSSVAVEYRLIEGEAADEIVRLAQEEACDLIVLGTEGRKGLTRLLMGSIAEEILRHAPCPVLTIRKRSIHEEPIGQSTENAMA
jgi:nucleotide-binding universal stress UspA family protein